MKKYQKIIVLLLFLFSVFSLSGCTFEIKEDIQTYSIHTDLQKQYLNDKYDNIILYCTGNEDLSKPNPVTLEFSKEFEKVRVLISEYEDFRTQREYVGKGNKIDIYNLKIDTVYYWYYIGPDFVSTHQKFMIEGVSPRNLYVDGLTNVRDIGGWVTSDGKRTKQDVFFRSSKFNADESDALVISEDGIKCLKEDFKIKTELDLRESENNENGSITVSPLGSDVQYINFPMQSGGNCLLLNKNVLKDLFVILGNYNNYPMIMHCSIGTDRTGVVAFICNALLGVSDEGLYQDYLFSNFGLIYRLRNQKTINDYLNVISQEAGKTTSEKMYNYLISVGVSDSDITNFKNIMTE